MNIPTEQALDRAVERFLDSLGVKEEIVNQELILQAFYEGARVGTFLTDLQDAETEEELSMAIENNGGDLALATLLLEQAVLGDANYEEHEA